MRCALRKTDLLRPFGEYGPWKAMKPEKRPLKEWQCIAQAPRMSRQIHTRRRKKQECSRWEKCRSFWLSFVDIKRIIALLLVEALPCTLHHVIAAGSHAWPHICSMHNCSSRHVRPLAGCCWAR